VDLLKLRPLSRPLPAQSRGEEKIQTVLDLVLPSVACSSQRWPDCWNPFGIRDGQEIGKVSDKVFDEVCDEGGTKTAAFTLRHVWDLDALVAREIAAPETGAVRDFADQGI